jgi:hypothetical protein
MSSTQSMLKKYPQRIRSCNFGRLMKSKTRKNVVSFRVTENIRRILEQLTAKLTLSRGKRHTMTDILEEGLLLLAKREKV